ncbi:MAG: 50S ribosomal protein L35 [Patescibacteria group bacterium]
MNMVKTNKSLLKRVKITGSGKILKRPPHQNHFNAKDSGNQTRQKRGFKHAPKELMRSAKALLSDYI